MPIDTKQLTEALNNIKPKVEAIVSDDNKNASPQKNASDIDILGGLILLLCQFIEDGNLVDLDQEKRIQALEKALKIAAPAPAEPPAPNPAPAETPTV